MVLEWQLTPCVGGWVGVGGGGGHLNWRKENVAISNNINNIIITIISNNNNNNNNNNNIKYQQ